MKLKSKKVVILLCGILMFGVIFSIFKGTSANSNTSGLAEFTRYETGFAFNNTINIVQETMKAYYLKGSYIQYSFPRAEYGVNSPEEATAQDPKYLVCAAYTYSTLVESFGMEYDKETSTTPRYNSEILSEAARYYDTYAGNEDMMDGNYLIYYANNESNKKYIHDASNDDGKTRWEKFVEQIQPGDLFVYSGHAMMAYDKVDRNDDGVYDDVLILHSNGSFQIPSKIKSDETTRLSYDFIASNMNGKNAVSNGIFSAMNNGFFEGTITWKWLSDDENFVGENENGDNELICNVENVKECAIIRTFYEDNKGNTVFNYAYDVNKYNNSLLRTQYPGLQIEKTANVGDNNSIELGTQIDYTIKITNNSNLIDLSSNGVNYDPFYVEEYYDTNVVVLNDNKTSLYVTENNDNSSKNKIKWTINSVEVGETIELQYSVTVKDKNTYPNAINNINTNVIASGKFYSNNSNEFITTGTIKNKIVPTSTINKSSDYSSCFDNNKDSYAGLELIDKVYRCVYGADEYDNKFGNDFNFNDYEFNNIFEVNEATKKDSKNLLKIKDNMSEIDRIFYNMILNNYWNALTIQNTDGQEYTLFPKWWSEEISESRARTIISTHFKEGDVLIYQSVEDERFDNHTNEDGIYAYIYIGDKFVGINSPNGGNSVRNEFSYQYYTGEVPPNEISANKTDPITSSLMNDFYRRINVINYVYGDSLKLENLYSFINYQTLYGKDNYVILRPDLIKEIINIELVAPSKITYTQNQDIDLTGGHIKIEYNDGSSETVELSNDKIKINGFDTSSTGTKTIEVSYDDDYTFEYEIRVIVEGINSDVHTVDENNRLISNIMPGTTVEELIDGIITDGSISILDKDDNILELSTYLKTGDKLQVTYLDSLVTYDISISGDVDGNGIIDQNDIKLSSRYMIGENLDVELEYLKAIDFDNNNKMDINDIIKMARYIRDGALDE